MNSPAAGIICEIFNNPLFKGCSLNGISENYSKVVLVDKNIPKIFEADETMPAVVLVKRIICGEEYVHAEPLELNKAKKWCMAGGSFIHTSDGRYRDAVGHSYPISLHDRIE
jgi:hypothetical protein